ncbi:zinc knuckle (CCHC-type) family protein [Arabidopsis lyrata subsp. lyrata]|uniref:Zinc knuckle (CCHC-type) family protein n=1 Tax=Arabidopsis lyrata subsp. lyrata TaxID=81972 RepID=D7MNN1_ARALL|nr:zinc knuckle (CCHC-type) family protein [Arabidopsis lyrata subsp. lyrata]
MGDGDEQSKELEGLSSSSRRSSGPSSANAEARMKFASVDAITELVWSPGNGLSLRCADISFTGKAKLVSPNFFDIGLTNMAIHSNSTSIEHQEDVELRSRDQVNQERIGGSVEDMKPEMVEDKVETDDDIKNEVAGSSKRSSDSPKVMEGETRDLLVNEQLRMESAGSQEGPTNRGDKDEGDKANNRIDRLESMDENNLATLAVVACEGQGEYSLENEAGPSGSYRRPKQDSSFMNWISNMTKGIWKGNEEDDSPFAALTTTSDANGHGQVNAIVDQQQLSPCCVKENSGCRNTGFQSLFQSIYCPKKRSQDAVEMDFPNDANATSLQELPWIPEQCGIAKGDDLSSSDNDIGPVAEPNISSGKVGFNQRSETLSSENKREDKEPNISLMSLSKSKPNEEPKICGEAGGKVSPCLNNRNSGLQSLWISRFSSKSPFPQKKTSETAKEVNASASDTAKTHDSQKMLVNNNVVIPSISSVDGLDKLNTVLPIVSSMRIESSEAMASLFARRLEAMKHIIPAGSLAENAEEEQPNLICFYCGKKGHCLQDCLEVTDTELRDLVQNISSRNGREEASSLCIRCFQLSHWAATCPNGPLYSSGAEDRAMKHTLASTSGMKLPVSGFTDVPKAVFEAVQVLRLSRTDVLKWINTKKSVSGLEGFFLRLRLGKWEEGLGGTGYYVARIDEGQSSRRPSEKSSISVKVKGVTCLVESQFISNHDFLEEELKAWWRSAGKSAERSGCEGIPSAEELSRKIQQRKMLNR